jgi:hypothetical protein
VPQNLRQRPVRDFDVPEKNDLPELVGEQGVIGGLAFLHQQMAAFLDEPRPLRIDIDDHDPFSFPREM